MIYKKLLCFSYCDKLRQTATELQQNCDKLRQNATHIFY